MHRRITLRSSKRSMGNGARREDARQERSQVMNRTQSYLAINRVSRVPLWYGGAEAGLKLYISLRRGS